jgi:hypothetical protein
MMNSNRTFNVSSRARTFLVILACAVPGFASRAEASPFMLNLVSGGSSGGGGGRSGGTGGGGSASPLGLNLGGVTGQPSTTGGSRITDPSTTAPATMLSASPSFTVDAPGTTTESLTAAVRSSVASLNASGSLAQLELGNGETLYVAGPVVDALISSVSGGTPPTSEGASNTIEPSQPHTDRVVNDVISGGSGTAPASYGDAAPDSHALPNGGDSAVGAGINGGIPGSSVPDELVQSVFTDLVSGIVSSPTAMTNLSLGDVVAADDPISAAEPATLVLVASALTLSARRLRRRR